MLTDASHLSLYQHLKTKDIFVFLDQDEEKLVLINKAGKKIALSEVLFEEVEGEEFTLTKQQMLGYELYLQAENGPVKENHALKFEYYSHNLKILCKEILNWGFVNRKLNKFERDFFKVAN